jgi:hypothetical protein
VRKKDKKIEMLYKKLYQNFRYKEVNLKWAELIKLDNVFIAWNLTNKIITFYCIIVINREIESLIYWSKTLSFVVYVLVDRIPFIFGSVRIVCIKLILVAMIILWMKNAVNVNWISSIKFPVDFAVLQVIW